jgi:NTE family protein
MTVPPDRSESPYQPDRRREGRALCLSGGGFRAALFHLGALRRLNEVGLLSRFQTISSVSGGSITNGLLAAAWRKLTAGEGGVFTNFPALIEATLRRFCGQDLRTGPLLLDRLDPRNWLHLMGDDHSATDFLAQGYRDRLVHDLRLEDLKAIQAAGGPKFVFDASNLQTGVNFTFSGDGVGDWKIGHTAAPKLLVAEAIAASSAFPIAFPPLVLKFEPGAFDGGALAEDPTHRDLSRRVVLSDGGVYDNLGLEPIWKHHELVLCSDGGKPFGITLDPGESPPARLLRAQDVIGNQALAVRKRWLIASLETGVYRGAYWGMGTEIEDYPTRGRGYADRALDLLRAVRTDLDAFTEGEQLVLMNHGWALADAALRSYVAHELSVSVPAGTPPDANLLTDQDAAAEALKDSAKIRILGR